MRIKLFWLFLLGISSLSFAPLAGGGSPDRDESGRQAVIEARAWLAESGQYRFRNNTRNLSESMPLEPDSLPVFGARVIDAAFSGHPAMLGSVETDMTLRSLVNTALFAISTGQAASSTPAPGTAFGSRGDTPDQASLFLTLEPEQGRSLLFVTWNLFTTEIPNFAALGFDDVFSIHVVDSSSKRKLVEVASSDDRMYPVSDSRAAGTGFDLYAQNPAILPVEYGLGAPAAWMSGWRTTGFAVDSSGPVEVEIEVRDGLDGLMDTQVLIEQIHLSALIPAALAESGQVGPAAKIASASATIAMRCFRSPGRSPEREIRKTRPGCASSASRGAQTCRTSISRTNSGGCLFKASWPTA